MERERGRERDGKREMEREKRGRERVRGRGETSKEWSRGKRREEGEIGELSQTER